MAKREVNQKRLAKSLSEVLSNEETPKVLHDSITAALQVMSNYVDFQTPEMIESHLKAYKGNEHLHFEVVANNKVSGGNT